MSTEPHDQHLSDAVDGQLSAERLGALRRDVELATRLQQLRRDAAAVRQLGEQTRREIEIQRGGPGAKRRSMAAAVLAESIRRAEQQQLDAAHPLILASESIGSQPVGARDRRMSLTRWSAVAALAASVALWFSLAPPPTPNLAIDLGDPAAPVAPMAPRVGGDETLGSAVVASSAADVPATNGLAAVELPELGESVAAPVARPAAEPRIAKNDPISSPQLQSPPDPETAAALSQYLVVYDVRLTEMGRALRPVRTAMAAAGLDSGDAYRIDQSVVDVARSITEPQDTFRVMVLRAPLTTLDVLFSELAENEESVDSIGLTMVSDAAVGKLIQSVLDQVVAANPVGVELIDGEDQPPVQLAGWIGNQAFVPIAGGGVRASTGAMAAKSAADGTVLVLIR